MITRLRDPRLLGALVVLVALFVAATLVPLPSIEQIRAWADAVGPVFPLVFFLVHTVVTIAPIPRTLFTVSAGVLFGAATGLAVTIAATTISAVLALLIVRAMGRDAVAAHLTHPAVRAVDDRLSRRGWLAVGSLRLIAAVPFSVVNYCCGVSSVRLVPYTLATVVGILPGTIGVVLLGDALTGNANPMLLVVSGVCIAAGVAGLLLDARTPITRDTSADR
ncbi:TVP38/TMEM64 family protein [Prescottella subtropica]|uniref:TVP38/TMEM64 family protein n=1 Tax=Prescottella subtropica TaxID=2545757 RepID=UPI001F4F91E1|nr:TVP38/TMEM64 family protein [Prescottella subtropica]